MALGEPKFEANESASSQRSREEGGLEKKEKEKKTAEFSTSNVKRMRILKERKGQSTRNTKHRGEY